MSYRHVDVFAEAPFRGNGLVVVFCDALDHPAERLRTVTAELRQFETIFVFARAGSVRVDARIFTVEEELPFAGHPVIGAAAALHERLQADSARVDWRFVLGGRTVPVVSERDAEYYSAAMDQGAPTVSPPLPDDAGREAAASLGLGAGDLAGGPLQVVSTGLPYLIVPVTGAGLARARIATSDFQRFLDGLGARFVYVLDPTAQEGRSWDNAGAVEDVATGSAAGPAAAYLLEHGHARADAPLVISQGRFVGRPSTITVTRDSADHLWVGGPVRPVAAGVLDDLPPAGPPF